MRHILSKFTSLGALALLALALSAMASAAPASAATEHWAAAPQLPYGSSLEFTGKGEPYVTLMLELAGPYELTIVCDGMSLSGSAENPAGGGVGSVSATPLRLETCVAPGSGCTINGNGEIDLSPLTEVIAASGEDRLKGAPYWSSLTLTGCNDEIEGNYEFESSISADANPEYPGIYRIDREDSRFWFEPLGRIQVAVIQGVFSLSTPWEEPLALSSEASPGAPHWYLGSSKWSDLDTGLTTPVRSEEAVRLELESEVFGAEFDLNCESSVGGIGGSLKNPSGGGAGTMSATFKFHECRMPAYKGHCVVSPIEWNLPGVATQVGKAGSAAVEFVLPEGSESATFALKDKSPTERCELAGEFEIAGRLITSSTGDGRYSFAASEISVDSFFPATVGGGFALENEAGESLRLQS